MTTDDGTGRLRHARCEGEQNEGEHVECICIEHMSCLQRNEGEICVCGRMPVSMVVQSWRLKKEGVVPREGEGETLTVGDAQKM